MAVAVALSSIPADEISWNRFLGPSRQFDPFRNFGSAFVSVLPVFLGYYHLARLGALLGIAISAAMCFATQGCAFLVFAFQLVGHSAVLQGVTYVVVWLLLSMLGLVDTHEGVHFHRHPERAALASPNLSRNSVVDVISRLHSLTPRGGLGAPIQSLHWSPPGTYGVVAPTVSLTLRPLPYHTRQAFSRTIAASALQ